MKTPQRFTGGLRTMGGFNATWPFARLVLTDQGLTLRLFGFVHARSGWVGVAAAQRVVGGMLGSPGVRVVFTDGRRLVFWCFNPRRVLDAFRSHGVQVKESDSKPPKIWLGG